MSSLFISHNSSDKRFVRKLANDLEKVGIHCWVDEAEIKVGDSLVAKISKGIKGAKFVAAVLSPSSITSNWVKKELEIAINDEIERGTIRILPLLIKDCKIPTFLQGKLYADFRSSYNNGLNSLINRLIPKKFFKSKLSAQKTFLNTQNASVSFKDDFDRPIFRKYVDLKETIGRIRKNNPTKGGSLWADIGFIGIPNFERVELFCYERNRGMRFSIDFDLQRLASKSINDKEWQKRISNVEDAIWMRDAKIMQILNCKDIAVIWAGPNAPKVNAEWEISFYLDKTFGYMIFKRETKKRNDIDNLTLSEIRTSIEELSIIMEAIISEGLV